MLPLLQALLELLEQPLLVFRMSDGQLTHASESACQHLGYAAEDLLGTQLDRILSTTSVCLSPPIDAHNHSSTLTFQAAFRCRDGSLWQASTQLRWIEMHGQWHLIMQAQKASAAADQQADPLTGLATRAGLQRHLQGVSAMDPKTPVTCLFVDLDDFKRINDQWGHLVGDQVLQVVAHRLRGCFRPGDLLVRFGGDEFLAVLAPCPQAEATTVAERIVTALIDVVHVDHLRIAVSGSIGVAFGTAGDPIEALIHQADQAMYRRKNTRQSGEQGWELQPISRGRIVAADSTPKTGRR